MDCNCEKILEPVCLNGEWLFNNRCLLDCVVGENKLVVETIKPGQCEETKDGKDKCAQICTKDEDAPVCGDDGIRYPNECSFDLAVCKNPSLKILGDEKCQGDADSDSDDDSVKKEADDENADDAPLCPHGCNKMYHPVCGTDGKTYGNKCTLDLAACEQKKEITKAFDGPCSEKLMHNGT